MPQNQSQKKQVHQRPSSKTNQACIEKKVHPSASEVWILAPLKLQLNGQVSEKSDIAYMIVKALLNDGRGSECGRGTVMFILDTRHQSAILALACEEC